MNTFTLGLIVIAYLLSLAYLGFLGYKKKRHLPVIIWWGTSDESYRNGSFIRCYVYFRIRYRWLWRCGGRFRDGNPVALLPEYVYRSCDSFYLFRFAYPAYGAKLNVSTFPQLLGRHFRSRNIQVFVAAVIFIGMPLYAAVVMKGGAVFIEQIFSD